MFNESEAKLYRLFSADRIVHIMGIMRKTLSKLIYRKLSNQILRTPMQIIGAEWWVEFHSTSIPPVVYMHQKSKNGILRKAVGTTSEFLTKTVPLARMNASGELINHVNMSDTSNFIACFDLY